MFTIMFIERDRIKMGFKGMQMQKGKILLFFAQIITWKSVLFIQIRGKFLRGEISELPLNDKKIPNPVYRGSNERTMTA